MKLDWIVGLVCLFDGHDWSRWYVAVTAWSWDSNAWGHLTEEIRYCRRCWSRFEERFIPEHCVEIRRAVAP